MNTKLVIIISLSFFGFLDAKKCDFTAEQIKFIERILGGQKQFVSFVCKNAAIQETYAFEMPYWNNDKVIDYGQIARCFKEIKKRVGILNLDATNNKPYRDGDEYRWRDFIDSTPNCQYGYIVKAIHAFREIEGYNWPPYVE